MEKAVSDKGRGSGVGAMTRFIFRHIVRSPLKSLLTLLLAAAFMVGLMVLRVAAIRNEAELERLYQTITVDMEIVRGNTALVLDDGFIYQRTVDEILETGFVQSRYLEGMVQSDFVYRVLPDNSASEEDIFVGGKLYGIESTDEFFANRGAAGTVTYFDGWDESLFTREWEEDEALAVVLPQWLYEGLHMEENNQLCVVVTSDMGVVYETDVEVAGFYESPGNEDKEWILTSISMLQEISGNVMGYDRAIFTLDPAQNRQLPEFREAAEAIVSDYSAGRQELRALFWDQELTQAVEPLEQVISFMEILYPVTVALSVLVSAGVAVLLTLTLAKEAAILRVLGNGKARCRTILCLQTILVCILGLVLGTAIAWGYAAVSLSDAGALLSEALIRAGLYLAASIIGSVVSCVLMTLGNPLELLQVKE